METDIQVQEAQGISNETNPKKVTQRQIISKMTKLRRRENIKRQGKAELHTRGLP